MTAMLRSLRRGAGAAKRWLSPTAEAAAWRHACSLAGGTPRYTRGRIDLAGYTIRYADLLTLCPQWHDIFVSGALDFRAGSDAPRILDCGANIGLATLYFKRRYPAARITAFEPDPALADLLEMNVRENGAADVDVVRAAVWTDPGSVQFRAEGADSGAIDGVSAGLEGRLVTVPSVRLADVIAREPIDLLKLDIEGAEAAVLADCAHVLRNVRAMVIDLHEFDARRRQAPRVLERLSQSGFTYAVSDLSPLPWRRVPQEAHAASPFPAHALCWAMTVRAWRA